MPTCAAHRLLTATCLLVHDGGRGVAAEALVAGVPQLVLSAQLDTISTGRRWKGRAWEAS